MKPEELTWDGWQSASDIAYTYGISDRWVRKIFEQLGNKVVRALLVHNVGSSQTTAAKPVYRRIVQ